MTINDGLKLKGRPAEIPGASRDDLPGFFKQMGCKVGAEIGTYEGEFTEKFCKAGLRMYAVDPWEDNSPHFSDKKNYKEQYNSAYVTAVTRLKPYGCKFVKKTSMDAVKDFGNGTLDFVYIDGNHNFRYIVEDIWEWYRKIKPGGVISGHDYELLWNNPYRLAACHVKTAVDVMAGIYNVDYYVLGSNYGNRDKHRSWLWIKPKE